MRDQPPAKATTADRFWAKVEKTATCWLWTGARQNKGYGVFDNNGTKLAHRISWEMANGPIPGGLYACHRCDVRNCVRPDHLFLGTQKENLADAITKGRRIGPTAQHWEPVGGQCPQGHLYDATKLRRGWVVKWCRQCDREISRKRRARLAEAALAKPERRK